MKIQHNKNNSIPITERKFRDYLIQKYGLRFNYEDHRCSCCGKVRMANASAIISKKKLKESLEVHSHRDDYLYNIANDFNFVEVKNVSRKCYEGNFYDLTIEDSNNYVAGLTNMIFIHNTHVAGTIAAEDNDIGVVGVAPDADIYMVKTLDYAATGSASDMVAGIEWAVENNMQIVNMSLGSDTDSISFRRSVDKAYNSGVLIVAAAGNNGNGMGTGDNMDYPSRYPWTVSVGATDINDKRAKFSSTGPFLEISAPGVDIPSTLPRNKYGILSGTSMAAPHVTGVAALVMKANPEMRAVQVRMRLQITAQNVDKKKNGTKNGIKGNDWYGYGIVDAVRAISI